MLALRRKQARGRLRDDTRGNVFIEAALVLPLLIIVLAGILEWGLALFQYNQLSMATGNAVRQLIISRGYTTPYTDVTDQFTAWARGLKFGSGTPGTITVTVNGTVCKTDAECITALNTALGKNATVTAQYDCIMQWTPAIASPCPITIAMTGVVE
jgi:Flp pilus assembly protein TadG